MELIVWQFAEAELYCAGMRTANGGGRRAKASEDRVARALACLLDDNYYLLRNVPLRAIPTTEFNDLRCAY